MVMGRNDPEPTELAWAFKCLPALVIFKLVSQLFFSLPFYIFIFPQFYKLVSVKAIFFIISVNDKNICKICSYKILISLQKI